MYSRTAFSTISSSKTARILAFGAASSAAAAFAWSSSSSSSLTTSASTPTATNSQFSGQEFRPFKLASVEQVTHDTNIYVFEAESPEFPCATILLAKAKDATGEDVIRPYTPIYTNANSVSLLIKRYNTGKLSEHISKLKVGDTLEMKGPITKFKFEPGQIKNLCMITGGTGITPAFQLIQAAAKLDKDANMYLIFANRSPQDILLKPVLDNYTKTSKLKIKYLVESNATGELLPGRVHKDLIKDFFPAPTENVKVFVCGPKGMMDVVSGDKAPDKSQGELSGLLKDLGYKPEQVYKY